jgi:hypothetical protein
MKQSARDVLLAADRGAQPDLDRMRTQILDQELGRAPSGMTWRAIAAAWLLIAILRAFTPGRPPVDPGSAELARASRLLAQDVAPLSTPTYEPFGEPRIP